MQPFWELKTALSVKHILELRSPYLSTGIYQFELWHISSPFQLQVNKNPVILRKNHWQLCHMLQTVKMVIRWNSQQSRIYWAVCWTIFNHFNISPTCINYAITNSNKKQSAFSWTIWLILSLIIIKYISFISSKNAVIVQAFIVLSLSNIHAYHLIKLA